MNFENVDFTIRTPTRPDGGGDTSAVPIAADADPATDPTDTDSTTDAGSCVAIGITNGLENGEMFDMINVYRQENGLNPVLYSLTLQQAANDFAERLFREDFFDHTAPDGSVPGDRAVAAGFCHEFVGENIASGLNLLSTAGEAQKGFKNSPPHNENMLREEWDYVGIGFFHALTAQGDEYRWVQLFGDHLDDWTLDHLVAR